MRSETRVISLEFLNKRLVLLQLIRKRSSGCTKGKQVLDCRGCHVDGYRPQASGPPHIVRVAGLFSRSILDLASGIESPSSSARCSASWTALPASVACANRQRAHGGRLALWTRFWMIFTLNVILFWDKSTAFIGWISVGPVWLSV